MPLVALVVAAAAGAILLLAVLGGLAVDRGRARSTADAAALAGAADGIEAARRITITNGCRLVGEPHQRADGELEVTVHCGRAEATARARMSWSGGGR